MNKKFLAWVILLVLLVSMMPLGVVAEGQYIFDGLDCLYEDELASLEVMAQTLYEQRGVRVSLAVIDGEEDVLEETAPEYFDDYGENYLHYIINDGYWYAEGGGDFIGNFDNSYYYELSDAYMRADMYFEGIRDYLMKADEILAALGVGPADPVLYAEKAEMPTAPVVSSVSAAPAVAEGEHPGVYFVDEAGLLSGDTAAKLNKKLSEISSRQKMDVVVVTLKTLDGKSAMEAADDYYDDNDYGQGSQKDGILLLICPEERDYWMTTTGYGITVFTDAGIEYIGDILKSHLKDDHYEDAFFAFADQADAFITQARTDRPYDRSNLPKAPLSVWWIPGSLAAGLSAAFGGVGSMRRKLKTVRRDDYAKVYLKEGSLHLVENQDIYLYKNVVSHYNPPKDSESSTHTSSSGTTHGGGGGKY